MPNIAVVGCGAIGLTSALAIQEKIPNANVTIFAKDRTPNTTSDIAAGLWEPYLLEDTPKEKIYQWSKATYDYVLKLWKEGKCKAAGVILQPVICLRDDPNYVLPDWLDITLGYKEYSKAQLINFGKKYDQTLTGGFIFTSFTWEGGIFLSYLEQIFLKNGGNIFEREINDLEELSSYDVVVNCTGIGARQLMGDEQVKPFRGQVMKIKAPWICHIYLIDTAKTGYVIPNTNVVVLGGTKQPVFSTKFSQEDANEILRKCSLVVPSIKSAEIIKHQVGLRPARDKVRLETEIKRIDRVRGEKTELKIVHNYGHGGSGITLCIGCAEEAAGLVKEVLQENLRSKL